MLNESSEQVTGYVGVERSQVVELTRISLDVVETYLIGSVARIAQILIDYFIVTPDRSFLTKASNFFSGSRIVGQSLLSESFERSIDSRVKDGVHFVRRIVLRKFIGSFAEVTVVTSVSD